MSAWDPERAAAYYDELGEGEWTRFEDGRTPRVGEAGLEGHLEERIVADVLDLSRCPDASFDATVCYGGALSYALDRAPEAAAELARVTRPGGHEAIRSRRARSSRKQSSRQGSCRSGAWTTGTCR